MKPLLWTPRRWAPLLPAVAYYGAIFYLSSRSRFPSLPAFPLSDKLLHGLIFAGFALALLWGFRRIMRPNTYAAWIAAAVVGGMGAILDEMHQIIVPLRHADLVDVLADVIGMGAALAASALIRRFRRRPD